MTILLRRTLAGVAAAATAATLTIAPLATAAPTASDQKSHRVHRLDKDVRFATFNASLNRSAEGDLVRDLSTRDNTQARVIAEIIQRTNPDVLLINEFDHVAGGTAARLFRDNYLRVGQRGARPVDYPYFYVAPVNTGVPSGFDLNNNGVVGGGDDAFGFGLFPGQYGMVVYSKYPIDTRNVRTFQKFLWRDMPGAVLPDDPATPAPPTGTRRPNSTCSGCRASRTGTCPSASDAAPCTFSPPTPRRPRSTAPRTVTAPATMTRSASGPTT